MTHQPRWLAENQEPLGFVKDFEQLQYLGTLGARA